MNVNRVSVPVSLVTLCSVVMQAFNEPRRVCKLEIIFWFLREREREREREDKYT